MSEMCDLNHINVSLITDNNPTEPNIIKLVSPKSTCECDCPMLGEIISRTGFTGEYGKTRIVNYPREGVNNLILVGTGPLDELTQLKLEELGGDICGAILSIKDEANFQLIGELDDSQKLAIAHGIQLRSWRFTKYMSDKTESAVKSLKISISDIKSSTEIKNSLDQVLDGVSLTRLLVSEPANVIYPESFIKRVEFLKQLGLKIKILDKKEIEENGMNALLAVSKGSNNDPRLLVVEWHGDDSNNDYQVGVIGKGVTFDSGGINLKSGNYLANMKTDMSGSAVVVGLMQILAARKTRVNAVGVCGLVENMPSGTAQKVGDIVKSMSGTTIEVMDTDAEGRMVLADCLTYAQKKYSPKTVIDLATLTGAVVVALGEEYAGLFSNCDKIAEQILLAGKETGELLWRLPLCKKFDDSIKSDYADIMNLSKPGTGAGSSTAASFLKRFILDNTEWIHLDIAGTAYRKAGGKLHDKGATGFGVRLLHKFINDNYVTK